VTDFVVAIPVGPSEADAARARDLLDSLRAHEPRARAVVLIDDALEPREWPDGVAAIPNPRRGRGIGTLGGTCTATLAALAWVHEHAPGAWVMRLDSDALVIGPFAEALDSAWRTDDGILGSCHMTCNGEPRDLTPWSRTARMHARRVWVWLHPPRRLRHVQRAVPVVRQVARAALLRQYRPGEHCIAAGCAISAELVGRAAAQGWLDDPRAWLNSRLGDDIMLGMMARALSLDLRDFHAVFGLKHIGLADTPQGLAERGFAVIHSVKNDARFPEEEVRAFFAGRR
jgi:hypothetical protein